VQQSLVLNATFEPLGVVSSRRATVLILTEKAVSVEDGEGALHSVSRVIMVPAVVRLTRYVRVPYRTGVPLTRRAVFARDGGRCVYCGAAATSLDHVVPRSRGGAHIWENVVSACGRCNHLKGDRDIRTLGWRLRHAPREPTGMAWRVLGTGRCDPTWMRWLSAPAGEAATAS
jgi:5-methylcytosine-specific restriction endonuclease McrA